MGKFELMGKYTEKILNGRHLVEPFPTKARKVNLGPACLCHLDQDGKHLEGVLCETHEEIAAEIWFATESGAVTERMAIYDELTAARNRCAKRSEDPFDALEMLDEFISDRGLEADLDGECEDEGGYG